MKLAFTLDYELFLGKDTGSVQKCLIEPLNLYLEQTRRHGVLFTIFVDASYLYVLHKQSEIYPVLKKDFDSIRNHLVSLQKEGHEIQLHIHPQWFFSEFNGERWILDTEHYKLSDVDTETVCRLFLDAKQLLDEIIGEKTIAFRAGGFSAQPTDMLTGILRKAGILIDSSVCPGACYDSLCQKYDYRNAPDSLYRFESDICVRDISGSFLELPITMYNVSPLFHWRLVMVKVLSKFLKTSFHRCIGDGVSVKTTRGSITGRLLKRVFTVSTIDGFKISFLKASIREQISKGAGYMCVLGHPKLATPYSIDKISDICEYARDNNIEFVTVSQIYNEKFENIY